MQSLRDVFDGWSGYQTSLLHAIESLSRDQLKWRPAANRRTVGELARHIGLGRINWIGRIGAPGIEKALALIPDWHTDADGVRHVVEDAVPADDPETLVKWLGISWEPIQRALDEWTVADLPETYRHRWNGKTYANSKQWTLWRVMAHDIHHGGQLALMLALLDVKAFELRTLGGHIVAPPLAAPEDAND